MHHDRRLLIMTYIITWYRYVELWLNVYRNELPDEKEIIAGMESIIDYMALPTIYDEDKL